MYSELIGVHIKMCGGIWGHNKTAALVKARRRVSGGRAGEKDGKGKSTHFNSFTAEAQPLKACFYAKLQGLWAKWASQ